MARQGLMDDSGYQGFEECSRYEDCCNEAYEQGKADAEKEIVPMIREIHTLVYNEAYLKGREEGFSKVIEYLKSQFLMQNNPNSKFVETIVLDKGIIDTLKQLKERKNED